MKILCSAILLAACASSSRSARGPRQVRDTVTIATDSSVRVVVLDSAGIAALKAMGIFQELAVDQPPEMLMMGQVRYPDELRRMGVQGRVTLRCILGPDGRVDPGTVQVVSAADVGFISAAREALLGARFRPAKVGGQPVRVVITVPIDFKIRARANTWRP